MLSPSPAADASASSEVDWLFLDLNSFFASVEQQENPALRGKPVAVVPVMTDATCAIAASAQAKKLGIKTGTNIGEARHKCPDLQLVLARHDTYVEYHHKIIQEVERHYPVNAVCSIDEMALRLDKRRRPVSAAIDLSKRIKAGLRRTMGECITCSIGLAPNRFLAKVASDMQKPDGLVFLTAADLPGRLLDLELRDLPGIGRRMEPRLHAVGIRTMRELWEASREDMHHAWGGVVGDRFWMALHGEPSEDEPEQDPKSIGHSHVLSPELRKPPQAAIVLRRLLLKAASRLRRANHRATEMRVSLRMEDGQRGEASQRFPAVNDSLALTDVMRRLWESVMQQTRWQRVKKVAVTLSGLESLTQPQQLDLFARGEDSRQRRESLSRVLDDINKKHGRDSIVIGFTPDTVRTFSGSKIAFNRIPDREEFKE
ncbi:MAG: Y-family DNA polymerase [Prosthecobacter sp.]